MRTERMVMPRAFRRGARATIFARPPRVISVDQECQIVWSRHREVLERNGLVIVCLDKRMRHGAEARYPEQLVREHGRSPGKARQIARARRHQPGLRPMRAPQAEVDQQFSGRGQHRACRLGGDQDLIVQKFISRVSTSCARGSGAVIRRIGSFGKKIVPSGMASTSPVKRNPARTCEEPASEAGRPNQALVGREAQCLQEMHRLLEASGHQEAAPRRQLAEEQFEHRRLRHPMGGVCLQHGEFVAIGQQRAVICHRRREPTGEHRSELRRTMRQVNPAELVRGI